LSLANTALLRVSVEPVNKTDYLLRQLVDSLEKNIDKTEALSPYEKWLGRKMEKEREEAKRFDKEMLEKEGLVFTPLENEVL